MRRIGLLLFFLLSISIAAHAEEGGYTVTPHDEKLPDSPSIDTDGADATLSFREFPLRIKIAYILGYLVTFFGFFKVIPIVFGRVKNIFENSNRKNISKYVLNNQGCTMAEISKELNINRGNVKYHIERLEADNKITLMKTGKFKRIFKNMGVWKDNEKIIASHLRNDTSRLLLWTILENPGITNQELAESFHLDKSTVHWHIENFSNDGMIMFETYGKFKKYSVNPAIEPDIVKFVSFNSLKS